MSNAPSFDYDLQVWTRNGVVQQCGHPKSMHNCCNGRKYAGKQVSEALALNDIEKGHYGTRAGHGLLSA